MISSVISTIDSNDNNRDFVEHVIDLIETHEYIAEEIINIFLVFKKARKTCLIESSRFQPDDVAHIVKLLESIVVDDFELCWTIENEAFGRFMVSRKKINILNDAHLGRLLGFVCAGDDYSNESLSRISVDIYARYDGKTYDIKTQVCEDKESKSQLKRLEQHAKSDVEKMNAACKLIPIHFNFDIRSITTQSIRFDRLLEKDYGFIEIHMDDYLDDFGNNFAIGVLSSNFEQGVKERNLDWEYYTEFWRTIILESDNIFDRYKKLTGYVGIEAGRRFNEHMEKFDEIAARYKRRILNWKRLMDKLI